MLQQQQALLCHHKRPYNFLETFLYKYDISVFSNDNKTDAKTLKKKVCIKEKYAAKYFEENNCLPFR
jgi:hypothetical protein